MERTLEQFNETIENAKWYVGRHQKPVWLVPTESNYRLSIVKPVPYGLPKNTSALLIENSVNGIVIGDTIMESSN